MSNPSVRDLKVLWAVDAFDELSVVRAHAAQIFQSWASQGVKLHIDPVYVLSPTLLGVSSDLAETWLETYIPKAERALKLAVETADLPAAGSPRVLHQLRGGLRGSVQVLNQFAQNEGYDLIVTGSHSSQGVDRWITGSFAEELILQSSVPVMVVGANQLEPEAGNGSTLKSKSKILFPSDTYGAEAPEHINLPFALASKLAADVTLLNVIPHPYEPIIQSGVYLLSGANAGWMSADHYLQEQDQTLKRSAEILVNHARTAFHLKCTALVKDASVSISASILENAKLLHADFIMMEAQSGPISAALLGSVTRKIVRQSPCPVIVFRQSIEQKSD